ncbi:hypothetical protein BBBOND_0103280 [Babesia bigemina]|uniref:Uncharacterized protein n=1 Tax=Babesia bigemina TaxID=5866 RepID=A0A061D4X4_BABBI|nr:hypothetical protein BBBOND_0103280 [Babesia bigemina]CDR94009.1 hypothetical protein BBBOND_0103280 [Babesia bigemina]|eukprot:XP_012766195.1 hypothetical protein BBBOND_0103280 [Babesia bigemina]
MAAAKVVTENCEGCSKLCSVYTGGTRCPKSCQLCILKKCDKNDRCQCYACTCGCQDNEDVKKGVKQCKDSNCDACKVLCQNLKAEQKCRCTFCDCGCQDAFKEGKRCYESTNKTCSKCKEKCKDSKDGACICYLCSCGCNGVNCQCCERCNPETRCQGTGKCDAEEVHGEKCPKGMCKQKAGSCAEVTCMCDDMGMEKRKDLCECKCRCEQQCPRILCDKKRSGGSNGQRGICNRSTKDECTCECQCNCNAYGKYYGKNGDVVRICDNDDNMHVYAIGKCRFKCTNCGRLCDQDRCMNWIRVIVIGLIILASLFVMRAIFPEKFRAIMTKIRATFASSPAHSGRSLNNLVGHRIPEETNVDRYPAFHPKTYAGLS